MRPNLFIVGAARCGTTSLSTALSRSKDIWAPSTKEPKTLAIDSHIQQMAGPGDIAAFSLKPKSLSEYLSLYSTNHCTYNLDSSTSYLYYHEESIDKIKNICDDSKIIIVLRDPTLRAFSQYNLMVREGRETESFANALKLEDQRIDAGWEYGWHYTRVGLYSDQVSAFINSGLEVKVLIFERLVSETEKCLEELSNFLGINETIRHIPLENQSSKTYPRWINTLKRSELILRLGAAAPSIIKNSFKSSLLTSNFDDSIDTATLKLLESSFSDDIKSLKKILNIKKLGWKFEN